jgi:fructose-specific phosphotransferase system IIA component
MQSAEFLDLFNEKHFIPRLQSKTKEEVLEELLRPLKEEDHLNKPVLLLETLKKRETLGSTGLGKQVAIPHCRTLTVSDLFIVIGRSEAGIEWQAMDKKKVHLIFLIIAPPQETQNIYLPVLGKICEMIRDNKLRKNLMKTEAYEQFIALIGEAL